MGGRLCYLSGMSLIEHLEQDDWDGFLRGCFRYALEVLKEDRDRPVGSAVDDLRSWLGVGGVARVRHHLGKQMEIRGFTPAQKAAVNDLLEQLVSERRGELLDLMSHGIIPGSSQDALTACGWPEPEVQELLDRLARGERPFEEWMQAHGHSDEEIAEVYRLIDRWLIHHEIVPPPLSFPDMN